MIFQLLYGFIAFTLDMKQFHLFVYISLPLHSDDSDRTSLLIRMLNLERIRNTNIGRIKVVQYEKKTHIVRPCPALAELYYLYHNLKHEGDIVGSCLLLLICLKFCFIKEQGRLIAVEYPLLILDFHLNLIHMINMLSL